MPALPIAHPLRCFAALCVPLALACGRGKDEGTDDSTPPTDDSTADDSTADDSTPEDTSYGEVFERQDAAFTVDFNGSTWSSEEGYWLGNTTSYLNATKSDGSRSQTVTVEIEGNIRYAGEYPIALIRYAEGPAQGSVDVNWEVSDPPGVTLVVEGFADSTFLHAHQEGTATLTATIGGSGDADWVDMTLTSWPKF